MQIVKNVLRVAVPISLAVTFLSGMLYATEQQILRIGANDPQIQIAEDGAQALAAGSAVDSIIPTKPVDIASSLSPYVIVFDDSGNVLGSSALLHGKIPALPPGVLDSARRNGQSRITWQPEPGVRSAIVIASFGGSRSGFVLAGRSLREVEKREYALELLVGIGWLGTLCGIVIITVLLELLLAPNALLRRIIPGGIKIAGFPWTTRPDTVEKNS